MATYREQLIPGQSYEIEFDDCCAQGRLFGTFVKYDGDPDYAEMEFDFGTLNGHGFQFEPVRASEIQG